MFGTIRRISNLTNLAVTSRALSVSYPPVSTVGIVLYHNVRQRKMHDGNCLAGGGGRCYVLSTLVLIFRYMSRSITISSFLSSEQLIFTVTKCVVSSSKKRSLEVEFKLIKQIYFQLQHQNHSPISHEFRARPSSR